jgi:hypothetical protein
MHDDGFCLEYRPDDNDTWLLRSPEGFTAWEKKVVRFDYAA